MDTGRLQGTTNATKFTKLSSSTSGTGINITQTSTLGNAIHTAVAGSVSFDRIFLYVTNTSSSAVVVTIEFGGVSVGFRIIYSVPAQNTALVVPGIPINGGLAVTAFAATTAVLNVIGYVETVL